MRHADSQGASDVRDHDRSITEAGRHSAAEVRKLAHSRFGSSNSSHLACCIYNGCIFMPGALPGTLMQMQHHVLELDSA